VSAERLEPVLEVDAVAVRCLLLPAASSAEVVVVVLLLLLLLMELAEVLPLLLVLLLLLLCSFLPAGSGGKRSLSLMFTCGAVTNQDAGQCVTLCVKPVW
jgi:hypothetical protein